MRYLCLVYVEEHALEALTESERKALVDASLDYDDALRRTGHYVASNALQRVSTATTVRARKGKVLRTDGPFAETKEQLGGFILIEAADMDEAVHVAARIPVARFGSIEIRPVQALTRA